MHPDEDFLRYTHASVFSWYQQADAKAQVILGFTGVFLSILVGALVAEYMKSGSPMRSCTVWSFSCSLSR
jgi:hypothetical protein